MAGQRNQARPERVIARVLSLATEGMDLLDAHGLLPEAAAHFALAQEILRKAVEAP
jgi:hypothetical protein